MRNSRPKVSYKMERVTKDLTRLLDEIINYEIDDIRVQGLANVTEVIPSRDLSYCKVYVDITDKQKKDDVMKGLKSASPYIRHIVSDQLDLKKTPEFAFFYDETKDNANRIEELLKKIKSTN